MNSKTNRRTTSHLPWKQAQVLLKCLEADGRYNTALMCAAGFYLGLRIQDILRLRWKDISGDKTEVLEGKTKKCRELEFNSDFIALRDRYLATFPEGEQPAPDHYIFTRQRPTRHSEQGKKPITVKAANKRFRKALERYGIETDNPSSHTMRKTFGRRLWEARGKNDEALALLCEVFRHSSMAITRRYLGFTREEIAAAYHSL